VDAVELLLNQHREIEARLDRLLDTHEPERRSALLAEVGDHLGVHMASEEQVFYPAVKARRTEDILLESLEEHLSLKRLLADLMDIAPTDKTFGAKAKVLQEQCEHHHEEEEEHLFPKVRTLLDDAERLALGARMRALQQELRAEGAPREVMAAQTEKAAPLR
jgi:hemerythrin superfamily protein